MQTKEKPKILYVYDPLCGWCYGFTPVMQKIKDEYEGKIDFEIISGGMVTGDRIGPITNIAPYISQAHKRVEEYTGIKFGEKFLKELLWKEDYIMSSEKPSIALTVFKTFNNTPRAIDFAHDIQKTFYFEAQSLNDDATYLNLIAPYNIDKEEYRKRLNDEYYKKETYKEFLLSHKLEVSGFPTVIMYLGTKGYVISRGFASYEDLKKQINKLADFN